MNAKDLIALADKRLNDDPYTRLTPQTKGFVDRENCVFDVHSHIFDRRCIKVDYFLLRLANSTFANLIRQHLVNGPGITPTRITSKFLHADPVAAIYNDLEASFFAASDEESDWQEIGNILEQMNAKKESFNFSEAKSLSPSSISNLYSALRIVLKGNMSDVLKEYYRRHAISSLAKYKDRPFVSVVLMMDLEQGWGKETHKKYPDQVKEVNGIAATFPILPFLALDPRRTDLYEMFELAFLNDDSRFFGVKTYPSFGFASSDSRLHPIYQICEKFKIPVTTHCGGTAISTFDKVVTIKECQSETDCEPRTIKGSRKEIARQLNEPGNWKLVLQRFKNLKLNLGHFGGEEDWLNPNDPHGRVRTINDLMNTYENVYADFSFNIENPHLDQIFLDLVDSSELSQRRAMFGTDYWVVLPNTDLAKSSKRFLSNLSKYEDAFLMVNPKAFLFGKTQSL